MELTQLEAQKIIHTLGESGTPPEFGLEYFTVGLNEILKVIKEEYLESFIEQGGAAFKLVVSTYGGGKTHFLYCIRNLASSLNYLSSYITLSPTECPFSKLELVYKSTVANIAWIKQKEYYAKSPDELIKKIYSTNPQIAQREFEGIESMSFRNAVKNAFLFLKEGNFEDYSNVIQWLSGEDIPKHLGYKYGITERLDKTTAFRFLRSLCKWVRSCGFCGLILMFDEAERAMSIASSRERRQVLDNLRQLIDECAHYSLAGVIIFYAIPDERELLDSRFEAYEALRQRLEAPAFSRINPSSVKIDLERIAMSYSQKALLYEIARKLSNIYQIAYKTIFLAMPLERTIQTLADAVWQHRFSSISHRRIFVKSIITAFHILRDRQREPLSEKEAQELVIGQIKATEESEIQEIEGREF